MNRKGARRTFGGGFNTGKGCVWEGSEAVGSGRRKGLKERREGDPIRIHIFEARADGGGGSRGKY